MEIQFTKINPTQNMTILVESPVPREKQAHVANALMDYGSVCAEQVGFIDKPSDPTAWAKLQMMGGEFCGNATMSLGVFLVWKQGTHKSRIEVPLEVSGVNGIVSCLVTPKENGYQATVAMPPPNSVTQHTLFMDERPYDVCTVRFQGITHIVIPAEQIQGDRKDFLLRATQAWAPMIEDDARGFLLFDQKTMRIVPLIHVKSISSLVWERGCGSGTAAVGSYMAMRAQRAMCVDIAQPGGIINVQANYMHGAVTELSITGNVSISARGTAYIQDEKTP